MRSQTRGGKWQGCSALLLGLALLGTAPVREARAAIVAELEGPAEGQAVAGVSVIRGWAFSDTAGVSITQVTLLVDGSAVMGIPCCSERGDVASAFPQFPVANTRHSGFGITQNYNLFTPGAHTIEVAITDSSGAQQMLTHRVSVTKPGGFEFVDVADLSRATVERQGQDIVLSGVQIRESASQQTARINARLRWVRNTQSFGLVEASTLAPASSGTLLARTHRAKAQSIANTSPVRAVLESPSDGETVSGLAVIRGWTFAPAGRSVRQVRLVVDGAVLFTVPCCSERRDVATAFPTEPNALHSGFGVTFNYGLLASGVHTVAVEVEDSTGSTRTLTRGVVVRRLGEFEFLDDLDVSLATVRIANGGLVLEGVRLRESGTGQIATRTQRYRFAVSVQAFQLLEESGEEIIVTNPNCTTNGDTSGVGALRANPGSDGISLAEAIAAANNDPIVQRRAILFALQSLISCAIAATLEEGTISAPQTTGASLPPLTRGNVTIDGDINGDDTPDVTLAGTGLTVAAGQTTVRRLSVTDFPRSGIAIVASPGGSIADVAVCGIEATVPASSDPGDKAGVLLAVQSDAGTPGQLRNVLASGNRISGGRDGIRLEVGEPSSATAGPSLTGVVVSQNTIADAQDNGVRVATDQTQRATLTGIRIDGNTVRDVGEWGIVANGGMESSQNRLEVVIVNNEVGPTVRADGFGGFGGIAVIGGGQAASDNVVAGEIRDNQVGTNNSFGILVAGGLDGAQSARVEAVVDGNLVTQAGLDGILVTGGSDQAQNNTVDTEIRANQVQGVGRDGIHRTEAMVKCSVLNRMTRLEMPETVRLG